MMMKHGCGKGHEHWNMECENLTKYVINQTTISTANFI
jgi:hypothetical protein